MATGDKLGPFSDFCQTHNITPILLHHARKRAKGDRSYLAMELDDFVMAGFGEFARQWVLLSRREAYQAGTGLHHLWMNLGGSAGASSRWALNINEGIYPDRFWNVDLQDSEEGGLKKGDQATMEKRQKILTAMLDCPDGGVST